MIESAEITAGIGDDKIINIEEAKDGNNATIKVVLKEEIATDSIFMFKVGNISVTNITKDTDGKTYTLTVANKDLAETTDKGVTVTVNGKTSNSVALDYEVDLEAPTVTVSATYDETAGKVVITGQTKAGAEAVTVTLDGVTLTDVSLNADGSFTVSKVIDKQDTEQNLTITATATDTAGNVSDVANNTITIPADSAPVITSAEITAGIGDDKIINIEEAKDGNNATIKVVLKEEIATDSIFMFKVGNISVTNITKDTDGKTYTLTVANKDLAETTDKGVTVTVNGKTSNSVALDYEVDLEAPTVTVSATYDETAGKVVITGTGEAGAEVVVKFNGKDLPSVEVGSDGKFTVETEYTNSTALEQSLPIIATITDTAGNSSSVDDEITILPNIPDKVLEIESVNIRGTHGFEIAPNEYIYDTILDDGYINLKESQDNRSIIINATFNDLGQFDIKNMANVYLDGVKGSGNYSKTDGEFTSVFYMDGILEYFTGKDDAKTTYSVILEEWSGTKYTATYQIDLKIDLTPPTIEWEDNGSTLSGIATDAQTVKLYRKSDIGTDGAPLSHRTPIAETTPDGDGKFAFDKDKYQGETVVAIAEDAAKNISTTSEVFVIPTQKIRLELAEDTGYSNTDNITNNGTINIYGVDGMKWMYKTSDRGSWSSSNAEGNTIEWRHYFEYVQVALTKDGRNPIEETISDKITVTLDNTAPDVKVYYYNYEYNSKTDYESLTNTRTFYKYNKKAPFYDYNNVLIEEPYYGLGQGYKGDEKPSYVIDNDSGIYKFELYYARDIGADGRPIEGRSPIISKSPANAENRIEFDFSHLFDTLQSQDITYFIEDVAGNTQTITLGRDYYPARLEFNDTDTQRDGITSDGTITIRGLTVGQRYRWSNGYESGEAVAQGGGGTFMLKDGITAAQDIKIEVLDDAGNVIRTISLAHNNYYSYLEDKDGDRLPDVKYVQPISISPENIAKDITLTFKPSVEPIERYNGRLSGIEGVKPFNAFSSINGNAIYNILKYSYKLEMPDTGYDVKVYINNVEVIGKVQTTTTPSLTTWTATDGRATPKFNSKNDYDNSNNRNAVVDSDNVLRGLYDSGNKVEISINGEKIDISNLINDFTKNWALPVERTNITETYSADAKDDMVYVSGDVGGNSVAVSMGDGDDTFVIDGNILAGAAINMGSGDDFMFVKRNVNENVTIDMGSGDDRLFLMSVVKSSTVINMGDGDDELILLSYMNTPTTTNGGAGYDSLDTTAGLQLDMNNIRGFENIVIDGGSMSDLSVCKVYNLTFENIVANMNANFDGGVFDQSQAEAQGLKALHLSLGSSVGYPYPQFTNLSDEWILQDGFEAATDLSKYSQDGHSYKQYTHISNMGDNYNPYYDIWIDDHIYVV